MDVAWLDRLRTDSDLLAFGPDADALGWHYHEDGTVAGFAYGGEFYHANGDVTPNISVETTSALGRWYLPTGDKQVWMRAAGLLLGRKRPELDLIIAAAFAAPLTVFAGALYGPTLMVWGEPGTSKTTAQAVAASVWGHPRQTRESVSSTKAGVQHRMGYVRNLPVYWDDLQAANLHALSECIFVSTEGASGGKMRMQGKGLAARNYWQTIMVVCANVSLARYLRLAQMDRRRTRTSAGLRRLIEVEYHSRVCEPGLINPLEASRAFAALNYNYGIIGAEYAALLACNHARINDLVTTVSDRFAHRLKGVTPNETFQSGLCIVLIAGATLAREIGIPFDVEGLENFLIRNFLAARKLRRGVNPSASPAAGS